MVEQTVSAQAKQRPSGLHVRVSKQMSYVLRHGAEKEGIKMDSGGWVLMDDLIKCGKKAYKHLDLKFVMEVVDNNEKKRFEVKHENGLDWIRAAQGHTIQAVKDEDLLTPITDPFAWKTVIHGTYREPMPLIMKGGLNKMARNHVHMAPGIGKNNVISGMRGNCEVIVELNIAKAIYGPEDLPFFVSSN